MMLTRKIRINPSNEVLSNLWRISQQCSFVWNWALDQRINSPSLNVYEQKKFLPSLKKLYPELKKPCSQLLQNVFFLIDQSFKMFLTKKKQGDKKVKPPRHKKRQVFFTQEYPQKNVSFKFETNATGMVLKLAYGSRPAHWLCIPIEEIDDTNVKTVSVVYKDKKWYACITYSIALPPQKEDGEIVYFDPGVLTALTGIKTDGTFHEYSIRSLNAINRASNKLIDSLKSKLASKKKGSYHYRRLKKQIKSIYSKIATRTKAYLHTIANKILDDHQDAKSFEIGNWSKKDTLANTGNKYVDKKINRAVQNNHPLEKLIGYLTYKGAMRGQAVKRFDERGSSRTCVSCNYVHENGLNPAVRVFKCTRCCFKYPRDHHSCLNFVKKLNSALWQCLSGALPDRSIRTELHPFLFKPRYNTIIIAAT